MEWTASLRPVPCAKGAFGLSSGRCRRDPQPTGPSHQGDIPLDNLSRSSRSVLNRHTADRFTGETLFARIAECLPRKELFEAWEVARRIRRKLRGGPVVELAAGHGLLSAILLLLDDSSPSATCIDIRRPPSQERVLRALETRWPRLQGRVHAVEARIEETEVPDEALLVSVHACGALTDQVLDLAMASRSRVAVLPCCHAQEECDTGSLEGWMDASLAVDATRVARLRHAGFRVHATLIPAEITPQNRLLMAWPE